MHTIAALCQAGELETAYLQAKAALDEQPDDSYAQGNMHLAVLTCLKKYVNQADATATARWVRKLAALNLPAHAGRDDQLYWEIRKILATLAKRQYPPYAEVADLLRTLTTLPLAPVASVGRSVLFQAALKFKEHLPAQWWNWWNFAFLRPEDYVQDSFTPAGADKAIRLPALAETAYGAYAKSLEKQLTVFFGDKEAAKAEALALLPRLEELSGQYPNFGWIGFRRAKLLLALGDPSAALPTLLPIVRQKNRDYWAWQLLAEALLSTDPPAALACYYRAVQCPADEMYLGRLRETLANLLYQTGYLRAAQQQLHLLAKAKQAEGKQPGNAALLLMRQPWFATEHAPDTTGHTALLATAEAAAYGDLPWRPVVFQELIAATAEKPARVRLLPAGRSARALTVRLNKYPWLAKAALGTPLQVRCEQVNGFEQVMQLAARSDGTPWDTRPASRPEPSPTTTREFDGVLRIQAAGFGFVTDIFVPARLISQNSWTAGQRLLGTAISQFDRKKGKDGWVLQQASAVEADK
jgi:hypothetical protein